MGKYIYYKQWLVLHSTKKLQKLSDPSMLKIAARKGDITVTTIIIMFLKG